MLFWPIFPFHPHKDHPCPMIYLQSPMLTWPLFPSHPIRTSNAPMIYLLTHMLSWPLFPSHLIRTINAPISTYCLPCYPGLYFLPTPIRTIIAS